VADLTVEGEARRVFTSCEKVPDIVICCAGTTLVLRYVNIGSATPGFFADQSTETLEFSVKSVYFTALWTAHVLTLIALQSNPTFSPNISDI
jgi:hypothetical protein